VLEIPGVFRRRYSGVARILSYGDELIPLVTMDPETAVSSITGAEIPVSGAPREALMAQAVVARSFLIAAAPRHKGFDFCDTTHCQFLRSPAAAGSVVDHAVRSTAGITLQNQDAIIPCRYSAACGGHTDGRDELGYRYQSVECEGCLLNHYARRGHGLGLCQEGAIYLARKGWSYERILGLYLPAARLTA
jgi:peptidoglycan hydrolase-like amidase